MMNMQGLMQKAQAMQKKMQELQEEMGEKEVEGTAGGGMIKAIMTCKGQMKSLKIDPSLINAEDTEMMEDLIVACINDARQKADEKMAQETQKAMSDMGLPPGAMGGLPF
tara:strand:- start:2487 stop:2816 length:330 start_codon:yes stop_codon:yes gene_type:complete